MTSKEILTADLLDIVFDRRNKNYGAYTLRKYYPVRLFIAVIVTLSLVFLMVLLIDPKGKGKEMIEQVRSTLSLIQIEPVEEAIQLPEPEQQVQASRQPEPQRQFTEQIEIVDRTPIQPMERMRDLENINIGNTTIQGPPTGRLNIPPFNGPGEAGPATTTSSDNNTQKPLLQKPPSFPGGMEAWLEFLNRHLQTPDELEVGEKKTVRIRFKVDVDGSISEFQVMETGGHQYDREVMRVLKKMPKWEPAIVNGIHTATWFIQPVSFVGVEQ